MNVSRFVFVKWQTKQLDQQVDKGTKYRVYVIVNGKKLDIDFKNSVDGGFIEPQTYEHIGRFFNSD